MAIMNTSTDIRAKSLITTVTGYRDIVQQIYSSRLVSFDLFDTLVRRPFSKPTDLFGYMERKYGIHDFRFRRSVAEQQARELNRHKIDVCLTDIYEFLELDSSLELTEERGAIYPRNEVIDFYNLAREYNKPIAILSDMYLPKEFIAELLSRLNISYEYLYVSGTDQVAKFDGSMFRRLIVDSAEDRTNIIHIGDNEHSDFQVPSKMGLKAALINSDWALGLNTQIGQRIGERLALTQTDSGSRLSAVLRDFAFARGTSNGFWSEAGAYVSGPLAFSLASWICSDAKRTGIKKVGFIARDGWLVKYAFDRLGSEIDTSYLPLSRTVLALANLLTPSVALERQIASLLPKTLPELVGNFNLLDKDVKSELLSVVHAKELFYSTSELAPLLDSIVAKCPTLCKKIENAASSVSTLLKLFSGDLKPSEIGIYDIGWSGTVHSLMKELFPDASNWRQYYMGTSSEFLMPDAKSFGLFFYRGIPNHHSELVNSNLEWIEALLTSRDETVLMLALKNSKIIPIYAIPPKEAKSTARYRVKLVEEAERFIEFASAHPAMREWLPDRHVIFGLLETFGDIAKRHAAELKRYRHQPFIGNSPYTELKF